MRPMKNLMIYKFDEPLHISNQDLIDALSENQLRECGTEEIETYGWVSAFTQGESLSEEINGSFFFRLGMYVKKLSRKAIQTEIEKRAREHDIDVQNRTRYKELEEVITQEFIAKTFPEQHSILAYIDTEKNWLVIEATSEKKASYVTSMLRRSLGSLPVTGLTPTVDMPVIMTDWLRHETLWEKFGFLDVVELKELSKDEGGAARYKGIPINNSKEIDLNIEEGWSVTKIGLSYQDLITFSLDRDFRIKQIKYLDQFQEKLELSDDQNAVAQSNGFLLVDTVRQLIPDLFNMCYGNYQEKE